jgi:cytochrome c-type biogenesis protein CcmH/NrfF
MPVLIVLALASTGALAATSEQTKLVARDLVCLCGDCNRESLATCMCGYATARRVEIGEALDRGLEDAEIVADFVQNYGQIVLATPPPEGYNLLAWITPFAIMVLAAAVLRSVLVNWKRAPPAASPTAPETSAGSDESEHAQRMRNELQDFD